MSKKTTLIEFNEILHKIWPMLTLEKDRTAGTFTFKWNAPSFGVEATMTIHARHFINHSPKFWMTEAEFFARAMEPKMVDAMRKMLNKQKP